MALERSQKLAEVDDLFYGARASPPNVTHFQMKWFRGSACRCSSPLVWFSGARTSSSAEPAAYANTTRFGLA